jgi:hypothetical protein
VICAIGRAGELLIPGSGFEIERGRGFGVCYVILLVGLGLFCALFNRSDEVVPLKKILERGCPLCFLNRKRRRVEWEFELEDCPETRSFLWLSRITKLML